MAFGLKAHDFYINVITPNETKPWSATASIGWGHTIPFEDFFVGTNLKVYEFYDPNMKKIELKFDKNTNVEAIKLQRSSPSNEFPQAVVVGGDGYLNRFFFNDKSIDGVYQVAAVTEQLHFAEWIDNKGKEKFGRKYLNEIADAKEIRSCRSFQSFAKAFISYGEWKKPAPIGHDLEFVPISNLGNIKAGDEVEFKILFMGKELDETINGSLPQIRAYSEQSKSGFTSAFVEKGKVKFQVSSTGRWIVTLALDMPVNEKIAPELVGKALQKGYNATATFFVKEK